MYKNPNVLDLTDIKKYKITETVYGKPMTRGEYYDFIAVNSLDDQPENDKGYITQTSEGSITWKPIDMFKHKHSRTIEEVIDKNKSESYNGFWSKIMGFFLGDGRSNNQNLGD